MPRHPLSCGSLRGASAGPTARGGRWTPVHSAACPSSARRSCWSSWWWPSSSSVPTSCPSWPSRSVGCGATSGGSASGWSPTSGARSPTFPSTETITQAVRSPLSFLDTLADSHSAETGPHPTVDSGAEPPDVEGDAVQPSSELQPAGRHRPGGRGDAGDPRRAHRRPRRHRPPGPLERRGRARRPRDELSRSVRSGQTTGQPGAAIMAISLKRRSETRPKPDSMTLVEHLTELRRRVLICAVAFVVTATVAFLVYPWILSFLQHPYCQVGPAPAAGSTSPGPWTDWPCGSRSPPTVACSWPRRSCCGSCGASSPRASSRRRRSTPSPSSWRPSLCSAWAAWWPS